MHPTQLPAHVIDRIVFRRGRLHGFESIEPHKTALVVIDMQNVFCANGAVGEVTTAREIVPNINRLARATRAAGGTVVWVQMTIARWQDWALCGPALPVTQCHTRVCLYHVKPCYIVTGGERPDGDGNATHPLYRFCAAHPHLCRDQRR